MSLHILTERKKEKKETRLCLVFILSKTSLFHCLVIWWKRSNMACFWQVLVCYCTNILNIGQQNDVSWEDMIDISFSFIKPLWQILVSMDVFEQTRRRRILMRSSKFECLLSFFQSSFSRKSLVRLLLSSAHRKAGNIENLCKSRLIPVSYVSYITHKIVLCAFWVWKNFLAFFSKRVFLGNERLDCSHWLTNLNPDN